MCIEHKYLSIGYGHIGCSVVFKYNQQYLDEYELQCIAGNGIILIAELYAIRIAVDRILVIIQSKQYIITNIVIVSDCETALKLICVFLIQMKHV